MEYLILYHATSEKDFSGFIHSRGTAFVSRDINVAIDVLKNKLNVSSCKIIKSVIPLELAESLLKNEREYFGFFPYNLNSTEIVLRTKEEQEIFNTYLELS